MSAVIAPDEPPRDEPAAADLLKPKRGVRQTLLNVATGRTIEFVLQGRCDDADPWLFYFPGMMTAGFSRLAATSHIKPHEGYAGYAGHFLRAHLGLQVPPDCEIRVGDEIRGWTPGGLMVFDDSTEHEAWNRSDATRVVLLLDFRNPFRDEDAPGAALTPEVLALLEKEGLT